MGHTLLTSDRQMLITVQAANLEWGFVIAPLVPCNTYQTMTSIGVKMWSSFMQ